MTNIWRIRRQKLISSMLSVLTGQLILPDFLAWRSERVRILWDIHPLTSASLSLPPSFFCLPFFFSLFSTASHSPLRLSLFNLTKSSPSAAQLYSTGIEMGLSLPGTSRHGGKCQYNITGHPPSLSLTDTHTHTYLSLTIGGCAVPAVWRHLLVLVVLVAVEDGVFLHQRESPPTLLVQVWVWWLRSLHHMDVRLSIFNRHVPLLVSVDKKHFVEILTLLINFCYCLFISHFSCKRYFNPNKTGSLNKKNNHYK